MPLKKRKKNQFQIFARLSKVYIVLLPGGESAVVAGDDVRGRDDGGCRRGRRLEGFVASSLTLTVFVVKQAAQSVFFVVSFSAREFRLVLFVGSRGARVRRH